MSTMFLEGFDSWSYVTDGQGKGWALGGTTPSLVAGRYAGQALGQGAAPFTLSRSLPSTQTTVTLGAAFCIPASVSSTGKLFNVFNASGTTQVSLQIASGGNAMAVLDAAGTSHAVSGFAMPGSPYWTYIEMQIVWASSSSSSGTVLVFQDNLQIASFPIQTATSGTTSYSSVAYSLPSIALAGALDDIYCTNSASFGPIQICTLYPVSDVTPNTWTPNSGTSCYTQVDEAHQDGSSTFISATSNAQQQIFNIGALPGTIAGVLAVQASFCAQTSGNTMSSVIKSSGTIHTSPTAALTNTWLEYAPDALDLDPATGAPWTIAGVNALSVGVKNGSP